MFYKAFKILLHISLVLTLSLPVQVQAGTTTVQVKVTLTSVELVENNSVGNEWVTIGYVNGKEIEVNSPTTLKLKSSDTIKLKAYAEEQDKVPDKNAKEITVKVSSIKKSLDKPITVTVKENRGRYSGNTAEWKFTFKIEKG